jgi:hypothetical protein
MRPSRALLFMIGTWACGATWGLRIVAHTPAFHMWTPATISSSTSLARRTLPGTGPTMQEQEQQLQRSQVIVHRDGLVWPHVHAASLLMSIVVGFFLRIARLMSSSRSQAMAAARTSRPIFLDGALCEHVTDAEGGHEFCVCMQPIQRDGFASRRTERGGRWVYYVVKSEGADGSVVH